MFVVLLFADDRHPLAPLSVGIGKSIPHSGGRVKGHSAGVISVTPVRRAGSVSWTAAAVMATRSPTARAGRLATPSRGTSTRTAMPASGLTAVTDFVYGCKGKHDFFCRLCCEVQISFPERSTSFFFEPHVAGIMISRRIV